MIRNVYKIEFRLASGLSIGSGESVETDCDALVRRDGTPFIPGSALVGAYREMVRAKRGMKSQDEEDAEIKTYFGNVTVNTSSGSQSSKDKAIVSRIAVYDADVSGAYAISLRDNVALDPFKTAIDGAKFDREVVNAGTAFVTYFEETLPEKKAGMSPFARMILQAWFDGAFRFGAKTMRGLGAVDTNSVSVSWRTFVFPGAADHWADFDMYDDSADGWKAVSKDDVTAPDADAKKDAVAHDADKSSRIELRLKLEMRGGTIIRQYSTDVGEADYAQLENYDPSKGKNIPVIPGTSWAGAIRHRMRELLPGSEADKQNTLGQLFGYVEGDGSNGKRRSVICFSDSQIEGAKRLNVTRNAIDRFTGGTVDGALFTERTIYGGTCDLVISLPADTSDILKRALAAALADLHEGFLAVGGETSVGRGLFKITEINEDKLQFKPDDHEGEIVYGKLMEALTNRREGYDGTD